MGHDTHFLERLERVSPEHQALALRLYREPQEVKYIVSVVCTQADIPEDGDTRVALALEDGGDGPHVIVTRSGKFVTCLAKGMSVGPWPILSRAMLDSNSAWCAQVRACRDIKSDEMDALFRTIFTDDQCPSRAQIEELVPFCSFHAANLARNLADILETFYTLQETLLRHAGRNRGLLAYGGKLGKVLCGWGVDQRTITHTALLISLGIQHGSPLLRPLVEGYLEPFAMTLASFSTPSATLRAVWMIVQLEHLSVARLRELLNPDEPDSYDLYMPALLGRMLDATRAELPRYLRLLDSLQADLDAADPHAHRRISRHIELVRLCWEHRDLPLSQRAPLLAQHPSAHVPGWAAPFYDPATIEREPENIVQLLLSVDHLRTIFNGECALIYLYVPEIARRSAPLLYPIKPQRLTKRERYNRDLELLNAILHLQHHAVRVVAPKTPGRNDPCSCGSGKKYKKCCGANHDE